MKNKLATVLVCPIISDSRGIVLCSGANCVVWEPALMRTDKKIEINPANEFNPSAMTPENWRFLQTNKHDTPLTITVYQWIDDPENGDCGLKPKELECNCG